MTGVDYAAEYRGRYTTFSGGVRLIKEAGFIDHIDLVQFLAAEEIKPAHLAQVGDIAVVKSPDGEMVLGIVGGARIHCWQETGLVTIAMINDSDPNRPRSNIKRAFRF